MTKHTEDLAKLGWQYFECPACGSEGARAFPKPAQQEAVAWRVKWPAIGGGYKWLMVDRPLLEKEGFLNEALYTSPPAQRTWVGLTDEEFENAWSQSKGDVFFRIKPFALAIEAKLKEKNNG